MMTPAPTPLHRRIYPSPLGELTLVAGPNGLRELTWPDRPSGRAPTSGPPIGDEPTLVAAMLDVVVAQLDGYFAGERAVFDVDVDPVGTEFQLRAWAALRLIPYGEVRTYGEQARRIGAPTAVRAVGAANGRNPISIIVPCHRVVGSDGSLTGFGGGLDAKQYLLDLESRSQRLFG